MTIIQKLVLIASVTAATGLPQNAHAGTESAVLPKRLMGSVAHTDNFPPLPSDLRPGCEFNTEKVMETLPVDSSHWYVVPKWLAGEFAYGEMTTYYEKDFITNLVTTPNSTTPGINHGRYRGMLLDKKQNIWQLDKAAQVFNAHSEDNKNYRRFDDEIVGYMISPSHYTESSEGVQFWLNDASKIMVVTRMQRVRDFTLSEDGSVHVDVTETRFNLTGEPVYAVKVKGEMKKIQDFEPISRTSEYAETVRRLREHMASINKLSDAPDAPDVADKPQEKS